MLYKSTRGLAEKIPAQNAIVQGLATDGGLYVPESFPKLDPGLYEGEMPYARRAAGVIKPLFPSFDGLTSIMERGYSSFGHPDVAPMRALDADNFFLELFHGPTCAFKDMALQILPYLLTESLKMTGETKEIYILTATSGDTGKAALEGFRDVNGTRVLVFYPQDGVSQVQKMQMTTQEGKNVSVCGVVGNFDDTQTGVKRLFGDDSFVALLSSRNIRLSAANSINVGRLAPQIAYYVSSYAQMVADGQIKAGEKLNFCVPTGNFGNILAGWYAKQMGLPVGRLICASNKNDVLTELWQKGCYDRNRSFHATDSPSMDILISSNFERALYHFSGDDSEYVRDCMSQLDKNGVYSLNERAWRIFKEDFAVGSCDDLQTAATIKNVYNENGYLIDPHTAVAKFVYDNYRMSTGDITKTVVVSTASPYKFCGAVIKALGEPDGVDDLMQIDKLENFTHTTTPKALAELKNKAVRFETVVNADEMRNIAERFIM